MFQAYPFTCLHQEETLNDWPTSLNFVSTNHALMLTWCWDCSASHDISSFPCGTQLYSTMQSRFKQESQRRHQNYSNRLLQSWIGFHSWLGGLWSPRKKRKTGDLVEQFLSDLWGMFLSSVLLLDAVSVFKAFSPWSCIYRWGWSCSVFG